MGTFVYLVLTGLKRSFVTKESCSFQRCPSVLGFPRRNDLSTETLSVEPCCIEPCSTSEAEE